MLSAENWQKSLIGEKRYRKGENLLSQVQGICKRDLRRMSKVLGAGSQKGGFALNSKRRQGHVYAVIPGGAGISRRL